MSRIADSAIKGFLYQFNKTLVEILRADQNQEITIEGIIEDIDIESISGDTTAIQCKYHESSEKYVPSLIFKPLLLMAEAYSKSPTKPVKFNIFVHVPSETPAIRNITTLEIDTALASQDLTYQKIISRITRPFSTKSFISNVTIEFGPSLDDLEDQVKEELRKLQINSSDTDYILYPNALSLVAKISSISEEAKRKISKKILHNILSGVTTTIVNKWTLALRDRIKILQTMRKQVKNNLNINSQSRYLYFTRADMDEFSSHIISFICNFIAIYHTKPTHIKTPTIAIDCNTSTLNELAYRLFQKGVKVNTGLIGDNFVAEAFYRDPMLKRVSSRIEDREFHIRLLAFLDFPDAINQRKSDDFFFICNEIPSAIDTSDTNVYQIGVKNFRELEFVLNMRETND